jgi:hypothetical protein
MNSTLCVGIWNLGAIIILVWKHLATTIQSVKVYNSGQTILCFLGELIWFNCELFWFLIANPLIVKMHIYNQFSIVSKLIVDRTGHFEIFNYVEFHYYINKWSNWWNIGGL